MAAGDAAGDGKQLTPAAAVVPGAGAGGAGGSRSMGLSRSSPGSTSASMTLSIRSLPASFFNCTVYALPNSEICLFTGAESVGSLSNSTAKDFVSCSSSSNMGVRGSDVG